MKEYDMKITETLEKAVTVQTANQAEAEEKVGEAWNNSEYVLDSENSIGAKFTTESERASENSLIDVLFVEPGQYPRQIRIGSNLDDLRGAADGDIGCTYPFEDEIRVTLSECGKLLGLPLDRAMRTDDGEVYDIHVGPFLATGSTEGNFGPLSPELTEKFETKSHQSEMSMKMGKDMMVLPAPEEPAEVKEHNKGFKQKVKAFPELGDMQRRKNSMARPLAYITAAWSDKPHETKEEALRPSRQVYGAGRSPIYPMLIYMGLLKSNTPKKFKDKRDIPPELPKRRRILVVYGNDTGEAMKADIAVVKKYHIATTTPDGILTVEGKNKRKSQMRSARERGDGLYGKKLKTGRLISLSTPSS